MKPSQNQIAEMLFRTVALEATGVGHSDSARTVVQRQLAVWHVPPDEAVIRDGSGLSRYDYVSPRALVRILDAMRASPSFADYYDALPIAGVDGTIRGRMKGTPAENNVHAKTGSVALARSLSGYVTTADHHMLIFSILANNWTTRRSCGGAGAGCDRRASCRDDASLSAPALMAVTVKEASDRILAGVARCRDRARAAA